MSDEQPEKMDLRSMDIGEENRAKLKALFPAVFTETVDDKGEIVESIDFEKLKAELGTLSDLFEARRERYGMEWPGKKDCMRLIQQPSVATLKPCREESVNFDETENLFIEGDNLEVLKLLQKSYYSKVKMIYIDPPYNTGKEFIYPDKYSETLDTYLAYAGLADDEGKKFATNTPNEGRFHTKWLNMMFPRLYLASNLLRDDGVIFISIDDGEVCNLRKVCDEIFGEENFVANVVWQKKYAVSNDDPGIAPMHDHILVYQKSGKFQRRLLPRNEKQLKRYKNIDNDPRGDWSSDNYVSNKSRYERPTLWYPITHPKTGEEVWPEEDAVWRYSQEKHLKMVEENRLYWGPDFSYQKPRLKRFLSEIQGGVVPSTWWPFTEVGHNDEGQKETGQLLGKKIFSTPKPIRLINMMLNIASSTNDIVLDFFAGSAATAHAVLDCNYEEKNSHRKFIMIQLPEPCEENSEAFKSGHKNISDIGKERIRRVIKKIRDDRDNKQKESAGKLPGMEEEQHALDLGFKVLKLDRSNFKVWDGSDPKATEEAIAKQLDLFVEHINPKSSQEDILYELLLKSGFMPTEKVEKLTFAGKTVFSIAEGALLICLEDEISRELIDAVAKAEPMRFICLDKGFKGNDQLKANAVQTFAARNQGREKAEQIVFRTV